MGTDPPCKPQRSYFFYPPDIEKLTKSPPPKETKAQRIRTCCICLTITFILISKQPTNTTSFLVILVI